LSAIDDYDGDGRLAVKLLTRDNTNYRCRLRPSVFDDVANEETWRAWLQSLSVLVRLPGCWRCSWRWLQAAEIRV